VVPAAGVGSRFAGKTPKQYAGLLGRTVLECCLENLLQVDHFEKIYVAISCDDEYWENLPISRHKKIIKITGGEERNDSVLNVLKAMQLQVADNDWILVHDAARPCICHTLILRLIETASQHSVGGILGLPISDTVKKVQNGVPPLIEITEDRCNLWRAQTPQMFRYGMLYHALLEAKQTGKSVTDESSAIEGLGFQPLIVPGSEENLKITYPEDLLLAEYYLKRKGNTIKP
jgi:2-C-methyl-D-erythritol 4-phosphate cytidylyltransferase